MFTKTHEAPTSSSPTADQASLIRLPSSMRVCLCSGSIFPFMDLSLWRWLELELHGLCKICRPSHVTKNSHVNLLGPFAMEKRMYEQRLLDAPSPNGNIKVVIIRTNSSYATKSSNYCTQQRKTTKVDLPIVRGPQYRPQNTMYDPCYQDPPKWCPSFWDTLNPKL